MKTNHLVGADMGEITIEYQRDVWDEQQKKLVSPLVVSNGKTYSAIDLRGFKSKYAVAKAIILCLEAVSKSAQTKSKGKVD